MVRPVPRHTTVILLLMTGLLPSVRLNLSSSGGGVGGKDLKDASIMIESSKYPSASEVHTTGGHPSAPVNARPYQMVAHSSFNDRVVKMQQPQPLPPVEAAQRPPFPIRKLHPTAEDEPARSTPPARYFDSYGEWHHGQQHWPQPTNYQNHHHGASGWGSAWPAYGSQHTHGNPLQLLGASLDVAGSHHYHQQQHIKQQHHSLLNLQLLVLLHPFLLLGTVSLIVCLLNAVLGLVEKVKLPLVRTRDELVSAGESVAAPADLRVGGDEHLFLAHLYQLLNIAHDQQQQQQAYNATEHPERL